MRDRRWGWLIAAIALLALAMRHPSADLRIITHDSSDRAPHRIQAALDLGVMAVSLLVTWTAKRIA